MTWKKPILFVVLLLICLTTCDDFKNANVHNITLLSLYSIHAAFLDYTCDTIIPSNVILSMVHDYVIKIANEQVLNDTGIALKSSFVDTCNNASVTLQKIVGSISTSHVFCDPWKDTYKNDKLDPLFAATGAFSGEIGVNVNYLLRAFCLPIVASASSSAELDNPSTYPYFLRAGTSDIYKAQVIFDLLQSQQWYHISVMFDSSSFGIALTNRFKDVISFCDGTDETDHTVEKIFRSPCVEGYYQISLQGDVNQDTVEKQLGTLLNGLNASTSRVLLVFMEDAEAGYLISYLAATLGYKIGDIQLILPSRHVDLSDMLEYAFVVEEMVDPFLPLDNIVFEPDLSSTDNEWIVELIEQNNLCCLVNDSKCSYSLMCKGHEKIKSIPDEARLGARHVYNAIMIVASALKNIHEKFCSPNEGLCRNLTETYTGELMLEYLLNTSFIDDNGKNFSVFHRAAEPTFNIFQYHGGSWHLVSGSYNPYVGALASPKNEDIEKIPIYDAIYREFQKCQQTCENSIPDITSKCCWSCISCGQGEYINLTMQSCENCSIDQIPNEFSNSCVPEPVPPLFYQPTAEMYLLIGFSGLGIFLSCFLGIYIYHKRTTPMVMASTPDLCYIQAVTQVLLFVNVGFMLPTSSLYICGAVWTTSTILLLIIHAVFMIKAIRLSRPRFYSKLIAYTNTPVKSSIVMLTCVFLSQLLICIIWVLLRPPTIYRTSDHLKYCSSNDEIQTTVLMILPMALVVFTFYFQRSAIRNKIMFQVRQARIGLAGTLCFIVNYSILLPLIFMENSPQYIRSTILMCVPLLTAYVSWTTMHLPVAYELFIRKKQNSHEYVSRERSRQFQAGNMVYYVDAMLVNRARTRTTQTASIT